MPSTASQIDDHRRSAKWDISSGPKNYAALVGTQGASAILALASVCLATRRLGPAGYGGIAAILAASICINQLVVSWTAISLSRYGCEEFVETGRITRAFWTRVLILVPNLLLVAVSLPLWLPPLTKWLRLPSDVYVLILAHLVATVFWLHVQHVLLAAKLPRVQAIMLAAERAFIFVVLLGFALIVEPTARVFIWAYILGPLGAGIVGLWRLRQLITFDKCPNQTKFIFFLWKNDVYFVQGLIAVDRPLLKKMIAFSMPLLPFSILGYFSTSSLDAMFISSFLSTASLGVYVMAAQLSGMLMQLPAQMGSLLLPLFVTLQMHQGDDKIALYCQGVLPLLTLAWSISCAIFAALGTYLLPVILGSDFQESGLLLWPLLAAASLAGPVMMGYGPIANARAIPYVVSVAAAISAGMNIMLNILLIPHYGLMGCAWATVASYGASLMTVLYLVRRHVAWRQGWIVQAVTPAVVGEAYHTWYRDEFGALGLAVCVTVMVVWLHPAQVMAGLRLLVGCLPISCRMGRRVRSVG